jgi:hypothetical protein
VSRDVRFSTRADGPVTDPLPRLNTRRFVQGKGTDREEGTIPTFLMVAHTLPRPRSEYPQREVQFEDEQEQDVEEQKVSVAPDSDKVVYSAVWVSLRAA